MILKTKFPVKVGDIYKIEKNNSTVVSVFGYKNKEKDPAYISKKCCEEKHVDLLLTKRTGKRDHILIKDFNTFMYNHTLYRKKKKNCRHCLQVFSTEEMLKHYIKDCFEINGKQRIIIPKKCESVKFKKYERKIKSPFIVLLIF